MENPTIISMKEAADLLTATEGRIFSVVFVKRTTGVQRTGMPPTPSPRRAFSRSGISTRRRTAQSRWTGSSPSAKAVRSMW